MNYPFWTLVTAIFLPYIWATAAMVYKIKMDGKVDIKTPRDQTARLEGAGKRANAAQSNAWEALAVFSACFLSAVAANVDPAQITLPATVWVACRITHGVSYIADIAMVRMLSFVGGMACNIIILTKIF